MDYSHIGIFIFCWSVCSMKNKSWWKKQWKWLFYKIVREKASPEYIARGWGIGMFYGCFIPFGLQLICSIPTAVVLKGSKIGASLGTLLTNPVSIIFIYPAQCWVGCKLIGKEISYESIKQSMNQVISHNGPWYESYQVLAAEGLDIIISFFSGGALLTAIMTPLTYFSVLWIVRRYQTLKKSKAAV